MKKNILEKLIKENGFVSGEELSKLFNVSRTAIWKHINELRKEGYSIESSSRKGYRLTSIPDLLDESSLSIPEGQLIGRKVIHFDEIDSTNNYAKKLANDGCSHGTVVIAERQTNGRGRVGREWKSNNNGGLWFSIVLRPEIEPESMQIVTLGASVSVVEAIYETQGIVCGIKWPNDIIVGSCKLGGILTELSAEPGHINYVIVGIGININQGQDEFDDDIKTKAVSLKMHMNKSASRADVLSSILSNFEKVYNQILNGNTHEIISRWNKHSVTIGKEVKIIIKDKELIGTAQSIAEDGRLIVKCSDGMVRQISAGEIQVRGLLGYV